MPDPLVDRELTGIADLGDIRRFIGPALLNDPKATAGAVFEIGETMNRESNFRHGT